MALIYADRVKETTTTTGTGTITLAGAEAGYQAFTDALSDADTCYYTITDGYDWEVGLGTFTASGTTLARTTVISSSNSDAAVDWDAGDKDVFITVPADKVQSVDRIGITIDGGGGVITTGVKGDLSVPFDCTINSVELLADQSGSITIDIWKDTYGNYPPTDADSITASAIPTISSAIKSQDGTLTGWTTAVSAGDILSFNVDSCTTITRCTLTLKVTK